MQKLPLSRNVSLKRPFFLLRIRLNGGSQNEQYGSEERLNNETNSIFAKWITKTVVMINLLPISIMNTEDYIYEVCSKISKTAFAVPKNCSRTASVTLRTAGIAALMQEGITSKDSTRNKIYSDPF